MWDSAFLTSSQAITYALLCRPVLPRGGKAFEKVSAAIAVRAALCSKQLEQTLLFLVPAPTANTARYVTAALLVGNYAHSNGGYSLPSEESRPLFKGDVLLVTPAISECKAELNALAIGPSQTLGDFWDVVPLSKYTKPRSLRPRVYLANPGWVLNGISRRFGAVVIDATHPRTISKLQQLLDAAIKCSAVRITIAPPLSNFVLRACGHPEKASVWLWDPQAMVDAELVVDNKKPPPLNVTSRTLWVCDSDSEINEALQSAYAHVTDAMKQSAGRMYPGLQLVWSILNRLRQTTAALVQLEQATLESWGGGLRQRIEALENINGHGEAVWDSTWPKLRSSIEGVYQLFLKRNETAKFWALASRVDELLTSDSGTFRIVVASPQDADLLTRMLEDTVDEFRAAIAKGQIELVTISEEAKLVAEGHSAHTLLLGSRPSALRYLDVFPPNDVEEFLYPFEVDVEHGALRRLYDMADRLQESETRVSFLRKFGLIALPSDERGPVVCWPTISVKRGNGHEVSITRSSQVEGRLDLDELAAFTELESEHGQAGIHVGGAHLSRSGQIVEVTFATNGCARYYKDQNVDVYFTASGQIQRESVLSLKPGWHVVTFVDGPYDSLFRRLSDGIQHRLPQQERIALALWQKAKARLAKQYGSKRTLYEKLESAGLATGYEVFTTWFRDGEEGVLAPQQFDDFALLAKESAAYPNTSLIQHTYECVQRARGRNRSGGRMLKALLRAIVSGDGYDEALESARKLDTALGDVLAAVEVLEVRSISILERSQ